MSGNGIVVERVLRERCYTAGYVVRDEIWRHGTESTPIRAAYSRLDGGYIGDPKTAYRLCRTRGIQPQRRTPDANVCSIGFCAREQKWYGWSHRAIYGFGIGYVVKPRTIPADDVGVGYRVRTLEDARRLAMLFAENVS